MLEGMRRNAQSWMIKALFAVIIIVFIFAFGMGGIGGGDKGNTLAMVNDRPIYTKDFEQSYRRSLETLRQQNPNVTPEDLAQMQFKQQVLAQMVNSELLLEQARKLDLYVTPTEIRSDISRVPAFQNEQSEFDPNVYRQVLSANNLTPGEFESGYSRNMLMEKLKNFVTLSVEVNEQEAKSLFDYAREQVRIDYVLFKAADHIDEVEATDEDVQEFYDNNKDRFEIPARASFEYLTFTPESLADPDEIDEAGVQEYYEKNRRQFVQPEMVKARHILFKADEDAPESEVNAARANAMKAMLRAREGEDFADLARELSEGPSSAQGGDLGWFPRGAMVEPFEEKAFAMKAGEVSDPLRTRFGWHVIKVEEKRAQSVKSESEAAGEIRNILAQEKAAGRLQDLLDQALERIIVGDGLAEIAEGLDVKLRRTGMVTLEELAQQIGLDQKDAQRLFDLVEGLPTDTPLPVQEGYILAAKTEFKPLSHRPLAEVRAIVVQAVKRQKAMDLAKERAAGILTEAFTSEDQDAVLAPYKDRIETSAPVGRGGVIQGLGMNPSLVEHAFAGRVGEWLPKTYAVSEGHVMARLAERGAPEDDKWEEQKEFWIASLEESKKNELFQAYVADLRENAKVSILAPEALQ